MKRKIVGIIIMMIFLVSFITTAEFIKINENPENEISNKDSLVAHWEFNKNNDNILYDSSGNGFHGTIYGNPEWTKGKIDDSLEFDSNDDFVSITENKTNLFSYLSQLGERFNICLVQS